jgi:hypothetical protein
VTYNVSVATGDGEDNGTTSNIYVDICGPKNRHTGKLFLDLTGKDRFEPVFGLTQPGLEPTTYHTRGEHANHYATDAVYYGLLTDF